MSSNAVAGLNKRWLPTIAILLGLVIVGSVFTELWTRKLWFDSLGMPVVFDVQLLTQVLLFVTFFALMALVVGLNMWLAFRARPLARRTGQSAILDRYRDLFELNPWLSIGVPAVAMGVIAGLSASGDPLVWLAWWNRTPFGNADPYFGLDASFYVFDYPVYTQLLAFGMGAVFFGAIAALLVHFAVGGIVTGRGRTRGVDGRAARLHLSILAGILLALYGVQQLLDRYGMLVSQGSLFTGMQYTDDHARLTAKLVIAIIAFICAGLFFANGFLKRWTLPMVGLILMLASGLILGLIYPAIVQSFTVKPNEPDKESTYIQANIDATRKAFDIADAKVTDYAAVVKVSPGQLKEDAEALPGIRLIDPAVVSSSFDQLQQVKGYYSFPDALDVDRYQLDGRETDVVVAARELDLSRVDQNWNNLHTVYTHGNGLVAAYGNRRSAGGDPVWIEHDLPSTGQLGDYEGRIYFGEESHNFAIVGREPGQAPIELDTPAGGANGSEAYNTYTGTGGVPIGNFFTRMLYAAKFADLNIILSDRVGSASRILYDRTPKQRVAEVAPWLTLDSNIYPAVVSGRLVWIVDGYTTSATYPNSQLESLRDSTTDASSALTGRQVDEQVNYLRNSVKAVVDASDGSVSLYAWNEADPILQTYMKAFPGTVQPRSAISADLLMHLRYPEDLFKVQRQVLARYHMTNPASWFQGSDLWQVPADPAQSGGSTGNGQSSPASTGVAEPPYYLSIKWPNDTSAVFSQTAVFVPYARSNLSAYLSVISEATSPDYGKMRVLRMSGTVQVDGPGQTFNAMTNDPRFAELLRSYLNQGSAEAKYGNLLTLPMGSGLLYVMPIYTTRTGSVGSYPVLRFVAARFGDQVGIGETLQEALDKVFAGDAGANTGEQPTTDPTTSPTTSPTTGPTSSPTGTPSAQPTSTPTGGGPVDQAGAQAAMQRADTAFQAAETALKSGDLAEYQRQVELAKKAVEEALVKLGKK
ncbi:hypothetical protein ATK74_1423 [Propionicimonas paludicola]|uniref:UPF0182 protein ATK74_1423 n=1 Tax=Propionicimonas paludicola TaxID=185243 RepID=A0A2A9CR70_9ACTN|nr:UPF0182 family protein [Propionicimonas paludicola]PFG16868.1 hypothetical protein ATK74_1423 [Propionicimonas paludicola]